ncbi:MAG: sensor histidine kinase [Pseudomonas sp.]
MTAVSELTDLQDADERPLWLKIPLWARWGGAVLFNTLIALFLSAVDYGGSLWVNWLFSQCIGLTINACVELALRLISVRPWRAVALVIAVVSGSLLGTGLAMLVTGVYRFEELVAQAFWQAVAIGLVFGTGITLFAYYRERTLRSEQALDAERLKLLSAEKARVETELRMLQAQVEPHFLFNTLAILRGLISRDPVAGKQLLDHLIDYLRASLSHSRCEQATLGDELDLLEHYLTIMQFRMGERLAFKIKIADELRSQPLAPMLLQPLVENAIRHGLEPKTGPGRVWIEVWDSGDGIQVEVIDNGIGFNTHSAAGTGLANIRARLETLYDGQARLTVEDNDQSGVTATLRLPRR